MLNQLNRYLGEYADKGFDLKEDDHGVYLLFKGEIIRLSDGTCGVFPGRAVTIESIQRACHQFLCELQVGMICFRCRKPITDDFYVKTLSEEVAHTYCQATGVKEAVLAELEHRYPAQNRGKII